jgi:hypothetical protein
MTSAGRVLEAGFGELFLAVWGDLDDFAFFGTTLCYPIFLP